MIDTLTKYISMLLPLVPARHTETVFCDPWLGHLEEETDEEITAALLQERKHATSRNDTGTTHLNARLGHP